MKALIHQRRTERFTLIYALYRKTNGMSKQAVNLRDLAHNEGLGMRSFKSCFDYLCEEGFVKMHTSSENPLESYYASLTEYGIAVVEEVFKDESLDTDYFPSFREMMM